MFSRETVLDLLTFAKDEWSVGPLSPPPEAVFDHFLRVRGLSTNLSPGLPSAPRLDEDRVAARGSDPSTARAAATASRESGRGKSQRQRILDVLPFDTKRARPLTAEEVAGRTGMPLNSASTRLSELERESRVATDERGRTAAGAQCKRYSREIPRRKRSW